MAGELDGDVRQLIDGNGLLYDTWSNLKFSPDHLKKITQYKHVEGLNEMNTRISMNK